jgi:hypothetical protein
MTKLATTPAPVNRRTELERKPKSDQQHPAGPCCRAWLEERADGLYRLRCNCETSAKTRPLFRRAA